jgi:hypothetical protein
MNYIEEIIKYSIDESNANGIGAIEKTTILGVQPKMIINPLLIPDEMDENELEMFKINSLHELNLNIVKSIFKNDISYYTRIIAYIPNDLG